MGMDRVIEALKAEEAELVAALEKVRTMIGVAGGAARRGRPPVQKVRRKLSKAGREAISRAAKKRWADKRKAEKTGPKKKSLRAVA